MKKFFVLLFIVIIFGYVYCYQDDIVNFIMKEVVFKQELPEYKNNNYFKNMNYSYVNLTEDFYLKSEEDIKNSIYTILNSGMTSYSLFCEKEYTNCLSDVEKITTDYNILNRINNFVHPFNSYDKIYITTYSFGKVELIINKLYSEKEIEDINSKINSIKQNIITSNMSTKDKIKAFHDYVINNTVYDLERANSINSDYSKDNKNQSHKANGVLNNHIGLCSGYTDLMAIFLNDLGVVNYKISNKNHIWNAVYLNNTWYHLDMTWDDPVVKTGENILIHDYFLITTQELETLDIKNQHAYDKTVYGF